MSCLPIMPYCWFSPRMKICRPGKLSSHSSASKRTECVPHTQISLAAFLHSWSPSLCWPQCQWMVTIYSSFHRKTYLKSVLLYFRNSKFTVSHFITETWPSKTCHRPAFQTCEIPDIIPALWTVSCLCPFPIYPMGTEWYIPLEYSFQNLTLLSLYCMYF